MIENPVLANRMYLSVNETADVVGVHNQTVWRWIRHKLIPTYKVGGRRMIAKRDLAEYMARCRRGA